MAERAGISPSSMAAIEQGRVEPEMATIEKITRACEQQGVFITENGVIQRSAGFYEVSGGDWWLRVLDDVYYSLLDKDGAECLFMFSDDRASPPEVNNRIRKIRNAGIGMRQIVEEGNRFLMGPVTEYKWVPRQYFQNYVTLIYGDKVAVCADDNTKAVIFKDAQLAAAWRNLFEMMWGKETLIDPDRSTADERF